MATTYGGYCATDDYRAVLDYSVSTGNTVYKITAHCKVQALYGWTTSGVSGSVRVGNSTSSGSIGTMNTGQIYTLATISEKSISRTHSAQTIALAASVSAYAGSSSTSASVTVPALASYKVTYNANKPSGASESVSSLPSTQTKWFNESLKLSSAKPTLSGYDFKGWATTSSGSVSYAPGATYSTNSALTLYAVWSKSYIAPTISSIKVYRCDSTGAASDDGTYAKVIVSWKVDTSKTANNTGKTIELRYKLVTDTSYPSSATVSANLSGTSGTYEATMSIGTGGGFLDDKSYHIQAKVIDNANGNSTKAATLSKAFFTLDFRKGGHGIGMGHSADIENTVRVGMSMQLDNYDFSCQDTDLPESTAPTADDVWGNGLYFYGATNQAGSVGYVRGIHKKTGYRGVQIEAQRRVSDNANNARNTTYLNLLVDKSGNKKVELQQSTWLEALGIEVGSVGQDNSVSGNGGYKDINVTFLKTHTSSVKVIPVIYTTTTSTAFNCNIYLRAVSATGFTVRIVNWENSARSPGFHWIAIG